MTHCSEWKKGLSMFLLLLPVFPLMGNQEPDFTMDIKVIAVPADFPGDINIQSGRTEGYLSADGATPVLIVSPPAEINLGSVVITLDRDDGVVWNTSQEDTKKMGISTLTNARVSGNFYEKAIVRNVTHLQYMEKREDGTFDLKTLTPEEGLGITISFDVTYTTETDRIKFTYQMIYTRSTGRETIPGVSLPIGKPKLESETVEMDIETELDVWILVNAFFIQKADTESGDFLLVFLRPGFIP